VYFEQKQGCQFNLGIGELFGGRIFLTALGPGTWRMFPTQLQQRLLIAALGARKDS
jgi:hypothetical protein